MFTKRPLDESMSWLPYPKTKEKQTLPSHGLPSYLYARSSIIFISYDGKLEKFKLPFLIILRHWIACVAGTGSSGRKKDAQHSRFDLHV